MQTMQQDRMGRIVTHEENSENRLFPRRRGSIVVAGIRGASA